MELSFSLLGLSYFISQPLGLGIWLFYLLTVAERGLFDAIGIASSETLLVGSFRSPKTMA